MNIKIHKCQFVEEMICSMNELLLKKKIAYVSM